MSTSLAIGVHFVGTEEPVDTCYILISGSTPKSYNLADTNLSKWFCFEVVSQLAQHVNEIKDLPAASGLRTAREGGMTPA